jgi:hypothetical protein
LERQPAGSGLFDVSCHSPRSCLAVGFGGAGHTRSERGPLAERFDGRRWRILAGAAVVDTGGAGASTLSAVSCSGARTCVAVGEYNWANGGDGYYSGAVEEQWDGVRWHAEAGTGSGHGQNLVLNSASCAGPSEEHVSMTDGPYAETKEQMGGFWIIQAADLDAALDLATRAAAASGGPIEVRPMQG